MSEAPTTPVVLPDDTQETRDNTNRNERMESIDRRVYSMSAEEIGSHFDRWEKGFEHVPSEEMLSLNDDPMEIDQSIWDDVEATRRTVPEYREITRSEKLATTFNYMNKTQTLERASLLGPAVIVMRHDKLGS